MSNVFVTPTKIARRALFHLQNNLVMGKLAYRKYQNEFVDPKAGGTVQVRLPNQFTVTDGAAVSLTELAEATVSITFATTDQKHVAWQHTAYEYTMNIEEYDERYIKPAAIALANKVDRVGCECYKEVAQYIGTAASTPDTFLKFGGAAQVLNEMAVPGEERALVLNPAAELYAADVMKGVYNPSIVEGAVRGMTTGRIAGLQTYMDQNIVAHTAGTGSGYLVDGASESGSSITVKTGTGTLKIGDIVTFAGVYWVNPVSKQSTGRLASFTITADYAGGAGDISIAPALTATGTRQNVSNVPADSAAVTKIASHTNNLAFHKNAFALVVLPLHEHESVKSKTVSDPQGAMSCRVMWYTDGDNDVEKCRLDVLFKWKTIYPGLACRLIA